MKKYLVLCILPITIISCDTRNKFEYRSSTNVKKKSGNFFVKQFKDITFYRCLKEGYGSNLYSNIFNQMKSKDLLVHLMTLIQK
jgi:hypothetical protein